MRISNENQSLGSGTPVHEGASTGKRDGRQMKAKAKLGQKYMDCLKRFPLRPIRTDEENELAAELSLPQILKLARRFNLSPTAFISEKQMQK